MNKTASATSSNLGIQYDDPSHPFLVFYVTVQLILILAGTLGNIMVILSFSFNNKLRTLTNVYIFSLAWADIIVTGFILPFNVLGILQSHHFFTLNTVLCEVIAFFCVTACIASLWNIMVISVNRYVYICHNKYYKRIFNLRNTVVMAIGVWVISALIDMPNFLNWGDNRFDMKTLVCSYDRTAQYGWILLFVSEVYYFLGLLTYCAT
ncbi:melatonin receptor type 1C-like [Saccoglossus kowalevskii]|uniref:Melatonin-related receptor-like n=1 Tax=Saccoglossus kowalevskii TaxID=10224 RepID=A0ABM0M2R8_SACKO|nr:PREDICTED: melatonin-related receptor-like [Saccoglossus kowalevskii]